MTFETSFTKIEKELEPGYRTRVAGAEGAADVRAAFAWLVREFLARLSGSDVVLDEGDVRLDAGVPEGFALGPGLAGNGEFSRFLEGTDLPDILGRQAQDALHKLQRLGKHSERDETKLFPRKDRKP